MILTRTYIDAIRRLLMQTAVAVMALVALSIVGACSSDVAGDEPCDVPREPVYKAGFYVTTGDLRLSRAPVPGDYEAGTPLENYIDMDGKDFRIFMFDENDTYVGQLDDIMIRQTSSDGTFKTYLVSGVIPAAVPRDDARQLAPHISGTGGRQDYTGRDCNRCRIHAGVHLSG